MKKKTKKTAAARPRKTPARVEWATLELRRGEAYALLAVASEAIGMGLEPPEEIAKDLAAAINKFRRAFKFKMGDAS